MNATVPTHTTCGHCRRTIKLKRSLWEPWTGDDGRVVGMLQTRRCKCRCNVVAALGGDEFMRLVMRHWNASGELRPQSVH